MADIPGVRKQGRSAIAFTYQMDDGWKSLVKRYSAWNVQPYVLAMVRDVALYLRDRVRSQYSSAHNSLTTRQLAPGGAGGLIGYRAEAYSKGAAARVGYLNIPNQPDTSEHRGVQHYYWSQEIGQQPQGQLSSAYASMRKYLSLYFARYFQAANNAQRARSKRGMATSSRSVANAEQQLLMAADELAARSQLFSRLYFWTSGGWANKSPQSIGRALGLLRQISIRGTAAHPAYLKVFRSSSTGGGLTEMLVNPADTQAVHGIMQRHWQEASTQLSAGAVPASTRGLQVKTLAPTGSLPATPQLGG